MVMRARPASVVVAALVLVGATLVGTGAGALRVTAFSVADEAGFRTALAALSGDASGPHTITVTADIALDDGTDPTYGGTQPLTVEGGGHTIDAGGTSRVLSMTSATTLTLRDLTVANGHAAGGEGITGGGVNAAAAGASLVLERVILSGNTLTTTGTASTVAAGGGGAYVGGSLTVTDSRVTDNGIEATAGLTGWGEGGGLLAGGTIAVSGSTIDHNHIVTSDPGHDAIGAGLVALYSTHTLTVVNSTITANSAVGVTGHSLGGGILSYKPATLTHVTLAGNSAGWGANLLSGGGTLTLSRSVFADPSGGGTNCSAGSTGALVSSGHNWSSDASCNLTGTGDTQSGGDPLLGALVDNGGLTPTRMPAAGSPLVDAIPNAACDAVVTVDQRGASRPEPAAGSCDIGAVERSVGAVAGTVSDAVSGDPVAGAWVAVLRVSDFTIAAGLVADAGGQFAAEVAPGDYLVYLIDPGGGHAAGFAGAPTVVTVALNQVTVDATMAPTRGTVVGAVLGDDTGDPIEGAFAVLVDLSTSAPGPGTVEEGGKFRIDGLAPGDWLAAFVDPSGAHRPEFFDDVPNAMEATRLSVTAGGETQVEGSLAYQGAPHGGAALGGAVTDSVTAGPVPGVWVIALHAADYQMAAAGSTDGSGEFAIDLDPGYYRFEIVDLAARYAMQWYDGHAFYEIADADPVEVPANLRVALDPTTGTLTGTVVDDPTGAPVADAWVVAIGPTGIAAGAVTAADGTYEIADLAAGTYRVTFADPNGGRTQEYHDDSPDYPGATPVNIVAGGSITVDAALALP